MFKPAHCSLYLLCSQEREREKLIPLFSSSLQHNHQRNRDLRDIGNLLLRCQWHNCERENDSLCVPKNMY